MKSAQNKLIVGLGVGALVAGWFLTKSLDKPSAPPLPKFDLMKASLQSHSGEMSLSDVPEPLLVLYFGYTFCPDACPTAVAKMTHAFKKMNPFEELKQVRFVFVSVDPERDDPNRLNEYLSHFDDRFLGVTSDRKTIDRLTARLGAAYHIHEPSEAGYYLVDHTTRFFVIDKNGKLLRSIDDHTSIDEVVDEILRLVRHYT